MLSTKGNGAGAYSQNIFCSNFSSLGYKCFKFFGYESVTKTSEIGYRTWKFQNSVHVDGYFTVRWNMIDKQRRKTPKKTLPANPISRLCETTAVSAIVCRLLCTRFSLFYNGIPNWFYRSNDCNVYIACIYIVYLDLLAKMSESNDARVRMLRLSFYLF